MAGISETLRQARAKSGLDMAGLAQKTKINPRYLEAIEAGDFGKLPSGSFAKMFVRQYADAVGLDGTSVAEEFQRTSSYGGDSTLDINSLAAARGNFHPEIPGLNTVADRVRADRLAGALSSLIWVVAAILVCSGVYYALAHLPSRPTLAVGPTTVGPMVTPAPASANHAEPPQTNPGETPAVKAPAVKAPESPKSPEAAGDEQRPAVSPPAAQGAIQLVITATDPVWVSAFADGKQVIAQVVPAGASKTVDASKAARLVLGNAGGAEVTFNGKKLEPFGPKGQVRTIDFTPWGAQVLSRTPPNPEADPLRSR